MLPAEAPEPPDAGSAELEVALPASGHHTTPTHKETPMTHGGDGNGGGGYRGGEGSNGGGFGFGGDGSSGG